MLEYQRTVGRHPQLIDVLQGGHHGVDLDGAGRPEVHGLRTVSIVEPLEGRFRELAFYQDDGRPFLHVGRNVPEQIIQDRRLQGGCKHDEN